MSAIPRQPVVDASTWRAEDFAGDDAWIHNLTGAEVAELESAVATVREQGLAAFEFGPARFVLPTLGPVLAAVRDEVENGRGFAMLRGIPVERYRAEDLDRLYAGIGVHLGRVITQNTRGDRIGRVTDRGTDYARENVRGHTSRGRILPHCDSADVVGLLCVHPARTGGESNIASATTIYNEIRARHPEYLAPLHRGFHINLAGKGPSGSPEECSGHRIPVFSYHASRLSCRYNRKQIEDGARILGHALSDLEREAIACVGTLALSDGIRLDMDFRAGDIQLLGNHGILHARNAYEDHPEPSRRRLLLRMWINTPVSRPLAPAFADRLNTGPRGEVAVLT